MDPVLSPTLAILLHLATPQVRPEELPPRQARHFTRVEERVLRVGRAAVERDPSNGLYRLTLAADLAHRQEDEGAWCAEARYLLEPLAEQPEWIPWSLVVGLRVNRACGGEAWPSAEVARHLLDVGTWDAAEAEIDAAEPRLAPLQVRPLRAALLEARASLHFSVGEHEQAVAALRRAIALDSTPDRRLRLGLSLMPLGEEREAKAQLAVGMVLDEKETKLRERARIAMDVLGDPEPPTDGPIEIGLPFPDLVLEQDGAQVPLSSLAGPLVVDLWATWCQPCVQAMPELAARAPAWADRGVQLLGVNVDLQKHPWLAFLQSHDVGYATAWAGPNAMEATGLRALPAVFVLDANHRVMGFAGGWTPASTERLEALVDSVSANSDAGGNAAAPIGD